MNKYLRLIILFLLVALGTTGQAAVYNVTNNSDVPLTPGSLRVAISNANSSAGPDTIRFNADYTINITSFIEIKDTLVIIGTGIDRTIIDGGSTTNAFSVFTAAGYVSFSYLTIRNTTLNGATTGAAISGGSSIALNTVKFVNNVSNVSNALTTDAVYGGAVSVAGGTVFATVDSCIFENNQIVNAINKGRVGGGAIGSTAGGGVTVFNSTFTGNTSSNDGGAIYSSGSIVLNNDSVSNNKAGYDIATSKFSDTTSNGGGLYVIDALTLQGSIIFKNNIASNNGGAFWKGSVNTVTTTALTNISIDSNVAVRGTGGGLHTRASLSLKNANITNNISGSRGGGIMSDTVSAALTLTDAVISGNKAGYDYVNNVFLSGINGGGIYAFCPLTLIGNIKFEDNKASNEGGALWKHSGGTFTTTGLTSLLVNRNSTNVGEGGGIYTLISLDLSGVGSVVFTNNSAGTNGGGLRTGGGAILTLSGTFSNNKAGYNSNTNTWGSGNGGGVYANGNLILKGAIICQNDTAAINGGGIYKTNTAGTTVSSSGLTSLNVSNNIARAGAGGGMYIDMPATLNPGGGNITINNNTAKTSGGGIYANSVLTLNNATISNNRTGYDIITGSWQASGDGGGIYANNNLTLSGTIICQNDTAAFNGGGIFKSSVAGTTISSSGLTSLNISNNVARKGAGGGINTNMVTTLDPGVGSITIYNNTANTNGGGIFANSVLTLNSATISNNRAGYDITTGSWQAFGDGGGIYANNNLTLGGAVTVQNDTAAINGGGIYKSNTAGTTFLSSGLTSLTISNNVARGNIGGGIYTNVSTTLDAGAGSISIINNTAKSLGGGIYAATSSPLTINNPTISGNRAGYNVVTAAWEGADGGGLYAADNLKLTGNVILDSNQAGIAGGGIFKTSSGTFDASNLTSLSITNCVSRGSAGGGINSQAPTTITVSGGIGIINNNTAKASGGGIYTTQSFSLENLSFSYNRAGYDIPNEIWTTSTSSNGGAIFVTGNLQLRGTINCDSNMASGNGGAIYKNTTGSFTIFGSLTVNGNTARTSAGGGIYTGVSLTLPGIVLTNNTAGTTGGGIFAVSTLISNGSKLFNNTAGTSGGGIYASSTLASTGDSIKNNTAGTNGGGVYALSISNFQNALITNNKVNSTGGGIYANKAITINGATISYNRSGLSDSINSAGGGIYLVADSLLLTGNIVFVKDSALQKVAIGTNNGGGAIAIAGASAKLIAMQSRGLTSLLIDSCYTNRGGDGGAIGVAISQSTPNTNTAAIYIIGGIACPITLSNNFADRNGGAISARGNTAYLQNIYFYKNAAATSSGAGGGAVFLSNTGGTGFAFNRSVSQCTFEENSISISTGAAINIGSDNTQVTPVTNCTFYNNKCTGGSASAINASSPTTISFCTFYGNTPAKSIIGSGVAGGTDYMFNGNILQDNIGTSSISGFSGYYNIIGATADPILGGVVNKNQVISTPSQILTQLTPANNGGATKTMLIRKGGLAHNFIPVDSAGKYGVTINVDQRDSTRYISCGYDAGAVELQVADSDPDATYLLKYDAINNPLILCGSTLVDIDTLVSNTTFMKDTIYFRDKAYSLPLASPLFINGSIAKDTIIYVQFISTNNCVALDSIKIKYYPIPTATFVKDTLVCIGSNTGLTIKLTGAKPFSFTYNNPQGNPVTINNYNDTIYTIPVSNVQADSVYTLVSVSSLGGCISNTFAKPSATVKMAPRPIIKVQTTADLNNVCENTPILLSAVITSSPEYTQTFFRWETSNGQGNFAANVGDRNVQYDPAVADQAKLIWIRARYQDNVCVGYYAMDSVQLRILPLATTVAAEIISQPITIQDICTDTSYIVKISTTDLGALKNITLSLLDNNNSHLEIGNAYVKQPYDAASWSAPLNVILFGDVLGTKWKVADSLNGKDSLQVKVDVAAKCNFSSGKTLQFNIDATDYCGNPITQVQKVTNPFYTDNDLTNVNTFTILDDLSPATVKNNTSDTVLWTLRTVVHGSQETDSVNELIHLFIPTGITPVPGSFTNIKNGSSNIVSTVVTAGGTSYEIRIRDKLTEGDSIISSLKLVTTGLACGTYNLQHEIKYYDSVTCSGVPCVTSASLVNMQNPLTIQRYRFSNIAGTGISTNDKWTGTINITAMDSTYVGDTIIIDFYKDINNDGKLDAGDVLSATVLRPTMGVPSGTVLPLPFTDIPFDAGKQLLAVAHGKALCDTILLPLVTIDGPSAVCQGDTTYFTMPTGMSTYNWKLTNPTVDATSGATPTRFIPQGDAGYPDNFYEANRIGVSWVNSAQTRYPTGTFTIYSWYTLAGVELAADSIKVTLSRRPYLQTSKADTSICNGESVEISHFFRDTNNVGTLSYYTKNADGSYTLLTQNTVTPNDTTVYAAYAVVPGTGCEAFDTVFVRVNVNSLPEATVSHDEEICNGDEIDLTFTLTSGKQLPQWKIEYSEGAVTKPEIINNTDTNTIILPVKPTVNTIYYVKKVTDGNGCVRVY